MSAKARSRIAVQWLPVVLFLGFVAVSALDTNATAASKIPVVANVAAGDAVGVPHPEREPHPIVIASLATQTSSVPAPVVAPITTPPLRRTIKPLISSTPVPAPARFFTINEMIARHSGRAAQGTLQDNIQLASVR